ncbi:AAA family ATPase [Rhizobium lusitanum]|uniref:AAA family ATPase n=1 Tax=Rhizobium lusitanum TaxID=293958 RepID=A0A6L9U6L9_9HYPH|nr:AAA family ATPase [Rhizobium lusitanum]NEI71049.1 AAA family ATPase [Rhizobium lusitanum]
MPISYLKVNNYMKVENVEFDPKNGVNEITGANGMGKSSTLNAIATMGGKKEIVWKPIRDGAEEAFIEIHLDGVGASTVRVVRRFWRKENGEVGDSVTVETADGMRAQKPETLLKSWLSAFTFDPLAFTRADDAQQVEILKTFVKDFDFDKEAENRKTAYEKRTDVNRQVRDLKSQVAGISVPAATPEAEIDISALTAELQEVGEFNADIQQRAANRQRVSDEADRFVIEAAQLDEQAATLRRQAQEAEDQAILKREMAASNRKRLEDAGPLPEPKDPGAVRERIASADAINSNVRQKKQLDALISRVNALEEQAATLTKEVEESDARKLEAVKKANLPVDGLSFGDDIILFNGQPLSQASQAEKIRVSVAIATAMSPKLKVALIKDGSLLDKKSWALLEQFADENGLQIFIETVDSERPTAVVIENGNIKNNGILEAAE